MSDPPTGLEALRKRIQLSEDWIPDLVLEELADDKLGHSDIVRKVADLIQTTETPANIAVFGPWGSGKSSFGRLLEKELRTRKALNRIVFFDAWKYDESPLRRHFLSVAAKALSPTKKGAADMKAALYTRRRKVEFKFDDDARTGVMSAAKWVSALIIGGSLALAVAASAVQGIDSFWTNLGATVSQSIGPLLLSTTALSIVAGALLSSIRRDYEEYEPSSAEQFDEIFSSLVATSPNSWRPIVFFIDELDRASPKSVVTMLETLKTFLGTKNCVFLVAADQIALETAVQREGTVSASQETNPYYSSGSAYLDKIFQYQFSLPAVRATRLSKFALDLVSGRGGLWADLVGNLRYVVSVLIPSHVRSLRRVKVLLNNFALTYRVFEVRKDQLGLERLIDSAPAIAKLVCLRTEFPLFFRALEDQPELANALTARIVGDRPAMERYASNESLARLVDYFARSGADVDVDVAPEASITFNGDPLEDPNDDQDTRARRASRADQLHNYLRRTREIPGPAYALIYLDSSATPVGMDPSLAAELEGYAVNGNGESGAQLVAGLSEGPAIGLRFIASLIADGVGVEQPNIAKVLLAAARNTSDDHLSLVATELVSALDPFISDPSVGPDEIRTLLRLGIQCSPRERRKVEVSLLSRAQTSGSYMRSLLRTADMFTPDGILDLRGRLILDIKGGGPSILSAARRTANGLGSPLVWTGEPARELGILLADHSDEPALLAVAKEVSGRDVEVGWTMMAATLQSVHSGEELVPKPIVDLISGLSDRAIGDAAVALVMSIPRNPANRRIFAEKVRADAKIDPPRLVEAVTFSAVQGMVSDAESITSRATLSELAPLLEIDEQIAKDASATLSKQLDSPWTAGDEVTRRRAVDLLDQVATKLPRQASLWRAPIVDIALASLRSTSPLDAKGREFLLAICRGLVGAAAAGGDDLRKLFDALDPSTPTPALSDADRRYLRMAVATTLKSVKVADLKQDADASAGSKSAMDRLTTALFVAAAHLRLPDAEPYLAAAFQVCGERTFSGARLDRYFSGLSTSAAFETLAYAVENDLPAPTASIVLMKPRLDERKAIKLVERHLKAANTNEDRARLIKYFVALAPDAEAARRQVEKQLVEVAGLNKGAFETVSAVLPDLFPLSSSAVRGLAKISKRHSKVSLSRRALDLLKAVGIR